MHNRSLVIVVGVLVLLFATFVWPTTYRYHGVDYGNYERTVVRVNRFTGDVDVLTIGGGAYGWRRLAPSKPGPVATTQK